MKIISSLLLNFYGQFRKAILITLAAVAVILFVFEFVLPLRECRKTEVTMTALVDQNNFLKQKCDQEKFENKWAEIAKKTYKNKEKKDEKNINTSDFGSTIHF